MSTDEGRVNDDTWNLEEKFAETISGLCFIKNIFIEAVRKYEEMIKERNHYRKLCDVHYASKTDEMELNALKSIVRKIERENYGAILKAAYPFKLENHKRLTDRLESVTSQRDGLSELVDRLRHSYLLAVDDLKRIRAQRDEVLLEYTNVMKERDTVLKESDETYSKLTEIEHQYEKTKRECARLNSIADQLQSELARVKKELADWKNSTSFLEKEYDRLLNKQSKETEIETLKMRLQSSIDERKRISVEKDNLQAIINAFIQQDAELLKHLYSNDQQQIDQIKLLKKNRSQDSAIDADGDEVEILEFDLPSLTTPADIDLVSGNDDLKFVRDVRPPASEKLRINDVVMSINGMDVSGYNQQMAFRILRSSLLTGPTRLIVRRRKPTGNLEVIHIRNKDEYGTGLCVERGTFISQVVHNSPAFCTGKFHRGDRILNVNGRDVDSMSEAEIEEALKHSDDVALIVSKWTPSQTPCLTQSSTSTSGIAVDSPDVKSPVWSESSPAEMKKNSPCQGIEIQRSGSWPESLLSFDNDSKEKIPKFKGAPPVVLREKRLTSKGNPRPNTVHSFRQMIHPNNLSYQAPKSPRPVQAVGRRTNSAKLNISGENKEDLNEYVKVLINRNGRDGEMDLNFGDVLKVKERKSNIWLVSKIDDQGIDTGEGFIPSLSRLEEEFLRQKNNDTKGIKYIVKKAFFRRRKQGDNFSTTISEDFQIFQALIKKRVNLKRPVVILGLFSNEICDKISSSYPKSYKYFKDKNHSEDKNLSLICERLHILFEFDESVFSNLIKNDLHPILLYLHYKDANKVLSKNCEKQKILEECRRTKNRLELNVSGVVECCLDLEGIIESLKKAIADVQSSTSFLPMTN